MSKSRLILAGAALSGLVALPLAMVPAGVASADDSTTSASTTSTEPLISVCITVDPQSVTLFVDGQPLTLGPVGVQRTCVATPF